MCCLKKKKKNQKVGFLKVFRILVFHFCWRGGGDRGTGTKKTTCSATCLIGNRISPVLITFKNPIQTILCLVKKLRMQFSFTQAPLEKARNHLYSFVSQLQVTSQTRQCHLQEHCRGYMASSVTWTTLVSAAQPLERVQVLCPTTTTPCKQSSVCKTGLQ